MQFVEIAFQDADLMLVMVDVTDEDDLSLFAEKVRKLDVPIILLLNKIDLLSEEEILQQIERWKSRFEAAEIIPVSALKKINLDKVFDCIVKHLPLGPPYYDKEELTDKPERFFVSEIIREKILLNYRQEVPYSVEVEVEAFQDEPNIVRIRALIYVNRKSQKSIIIGKGGKSIKRVGTQARLDMEKFLGKKVYLELFVKIKENWRDDDRFLKNRGY